MKNVFILFFMFLLTFFSKAQTNNHQKDTLLHLSKVVENMDFNPETKKYFNSIQTHFFYKNRNIQKEILKTFLEEIPQKGNINTVYIYKKDKLYKMIVSENSKELENIVFLYENDKVSEANFTNKTNLLNTEKQKLEYIDGKLNKITTIYTNTNEKYKSERIISYLSDTEIQVETQNTTEKNGEKQDSWQTNVLYFLDENKNVVKSVEEKDNRQEITSYTYDDKINPYFYQNHLKVIDPLFFLNEKFNKNNICSKKTQIIDKNKKDIFTLEEYVIDYQYNEKGYPTKAVRYIDNQPIQEKLFFY